MAEEEKQATLQKQLEEGNKQEKKVTGDFFMSFCKINTLT